MYVFVSVREREKERERDREIEKCMLCAVMHTTVYMGWLRLVGSIKLYVSFAKKTCRRDNILQKRPIILRSLLIVATP